MRETLSTLLQMAQDFCVDDTSTTVTGLTSSTTFLTREINHTIKDMFSLMKKYSLQPLPRTATTVAGQIWYHNPPGLAKLETVTVQTGSWTSPPLRIIHSQEEWDFLHQTPVAATNFPQAIFPRRDDFGIYPTPQSSSYTITLVGNYQPVNMTATDYSSGTVTVTQNSAAVAGSSTTFTASMVGRFFCVTDGNGIPTGNWYRIASYTSATAITLETVFEESTASGATYLIGDSPNVPEELHEFIPYRAASVYYAARRRDTDQAQRMLNYYYTGDYANASRRGNIRSGVLGYLQDLQENGRGNSQMTEMGGFHKRVNRFKYDVWGTTLSAP